MHDAELLFGETVPFIFHFGGARSCSLGFFNEVVISLLLTVLNQGQLDKQ